MTRKQMIKLFGEKNIRTVWDDKEEKWYFSIVDVVEVLTDSADPKQYIKKMRRRDPQLDANWGTICTLVQMKGADGKKRKQMANFRHEGDVPPHPVHSFSQGRAFQAVDGAGGQHACRPNARSGT